MCKWMVLTLVFLLSLFGERTTKIAKEYLKEDTLVLHGQSVSFVGLRSGVLVTFEIDNIHWGKLSSQKINIIYPFIKTPKELDLSNKLVFVEPMSAGANYKSIQEFSSSDKFFQQKLDSLDKLLAIEKLPQKLAQQQHFAYCIEQLKSNSSWQRWNGLWEWQHIVDSRKVTSEMLQTIILTYPLIPELSLKKRLRETIIDVKRRLGGSTVEQKHEDSPVQLSIEEAINKLKEQDLQKQIEAIHTIGQYHTPTCREVLLRNLQHSSLHIRNLCLFYLQFQGTASDIPKILHILKNDASLRVRKNAINVLGKLGAVEAAQEIEKYLDIKYTKYTAQRSLEMLQASENTWKKR